MRTLLPLCAAKHDLGTYLSLLATDGKLVMVGLPEEPVAFPAFNIVGSESWA